MTKVKVNPGACGNIATIEAISEDGVEAKLTVESGCKAVMKMIEEVGDTYEGMELCFEKPGCGPLYEYASKNFPPHCGCPVISGIVKAIEAECKLALPRDVSITFE